MLSQQIRTWGKVDGKIEDLFRLIDRASFLAPAFQDFAYADMTLPLLHGEIMLSPVVQAKLLQVLNLQVHETVLEVGTGNGFLTALLARQAKHVTSVEYYADLSEIALKNLAKVNGHNVKLCVGNAATGWALDAPVDAVIITGGLPFLPEAFKKCLKPNGRIVAILGEGAAMQVTLICLKGRQWISEKMFETTVPLLLKAPELERFVF
ncbi:MAG: protein-L-isoaspartate O-methyltransferase [Gammaproteobacteria bacterium]|nr:protein-L-isoaspartate O-methyltransferase [Gammaproteobacteria bacterium]